MYDMCDMYHIYHTYQYYITCLAISSVFAIQRFGVIFFLPPLFHKPRPCWEPLICIGCSKVSRACDKGYVEIFLKPTESAVKCCVQND